VRHFFTIEDVWQLADEVTGEPYPVDIDPEHDLAALPYSSGTTGLPKGVKLAHFNLTSNIRQNLALGLIDHYSVLLDFLPFFHIYGLEKEGLSVDAPRWSYSGLTWSRCSSSTSTATNLFVAPPHAGHGQPARPVALRYLLSDLYPVRCGSDGTGRGSARQRHVPVHRDPGLRPHRDQPHDQH
jgi:hypothetical protein